MRRQTLEFDGASSAQKVDDQCRGTVWHHTSQSTCANILNIDFYRKRRVRSVADEEQGIDDVYPRTKCRQILKFYGTSNVQKVVVVVDRFYI